jgi:predicted MFS family arabinose efflux permease
MTAGVAVGPSTRAPALAWRASGVGFLANTADNVVLLLVLWIAGPQGWTGIQTALIVLVLRVPALFFGGVVGRAVDGWGARRVARIDLVVRSASLLFLLVVGLLAGGLPLPAVLVAGGLSAAVSPATYAAIRWSVPRLARSEQLGRANAVVGLGEQLPLLVGGALIGPTLAWLGPVVSVAVPAVMLLIATVMARRLPTAGATAIADDTITGPSPGDRPQLRVPRRVTALILLSTAYYLAYGPYETAMPGFIRDRLHANPNAYSLVWAAFGLGAVAGLAAAPTLARSRPGLVNALGATLWGLLMLPVAVVGTVPAATGLFLLGGIVWGPYTTVEAGAIQRWTPPSRHGAVFGRQRALLGTAAPTGAAIGAVAVQYTAAHVVLAISAAMCALAGLLAVAHPALRRAG